MADVLVRVWVRVAGAKYVGISVVGHDVLGQDDRNRTSHIKLNELFFTHKQSLQVTRIVSITKTSTLQRLVLTIKAK